MGIQLKNSNGSFLYPNFDGSSFANFIGHNPRNLMKVLNASSVMDCFNKLRTKAGNKDYSNLYLGDYIDVPRWTVSGATETTTEPFRFQIVDFNHYYRVGNTDVSTYHITMESANVLFKRAMTDNNTNAAGYEGSNLRSLLQGSFKTTLESKIGSTIPISRLLDKSQCSTWSWVTDNVYSPTTVEIFGNKGWSYNMGWGNGSSQQFLMHNLNPSSIIHSFNGSRRWWWMANTSASHASNFCGCNTDGGSPNYGASDSDGGVVVAFNI